MVASTDIKWFSSDNLNAPQLTNDWGVMIGVLDACLINGLSVQSIASLTASGTTVTATFNTAHQYKQYQVIEISGAAQAEYNVQARILTVPNANSITFELASVPSVTTATGTITCKLPAMGWEKAFSGTQKAAYRSKNTVLASRPFLRVDNSLDPAYTATYAKYAKVGIVESMSDIDTMSGVQAPYDSANPTKNWVGTGSGASAINGWAKWFYALAATTTNGVAKTTVPTSGNRPWVIVGDGDIFYILLSHQPGESSFIVNGFGAFDSVLAIDNSNTLLSATNDYTQAQTGVTPNNNAYLTHAGGTTVTNSGVFVQRKHDQSSASAQVMPMNLVNNFVVYSGAQNYIAAPAVQGSILSFPIYMMESDKTIRGCVRHLNCLYQQKPYSSKVAFSEMGKMFLPINVAANTLEGQVLFNLGGL